MTEGIHVSVIAPSRYLQPFVAQEPPRIHYIAVQRVLSDATYRRFYLDQAERGASLVLDNGVFDLGRSLEVDELLRAAREVRSDEIVLPDVIHNGSATIQSSERCARVLHRVAKSVRLCAVVQGSSDYDWLKCYEHFINTDYVSVIAIPSPKHVTCFTGLAFDRLAATRYLDVNGLVASHVCYRLLGLGNSGHAELRQQRKYQWIRTVDSSAPVVLGALGQLILRTEPYLKPSISVDNLGDIHEERFNTIRANIRTIRESAGCTLRLPEEI